MDCSFFCAFLLSLRLSIASHVWHPTLKRLLSYLWATRSYLDLLKNSVSIFYSVRVSHSRVDGIMSLRFCKMNLFNLGLRIKNLPLDILWHSHSVNRVSSHAVDIVIHIFNLLHGCLHVRYLGLYRILRADRILSPLLHFAFYQ